MTPEYDWSTTKKERVMRAWTDKANSIYGIYRVNERS